MAELGEDAAPGFDGGEIQRVAELFGGPKVLRCPLRSPLDVHEALAEGLPGEAMLHLSDSLTRLRHDEIEAAIGMSARTVQRLKHAPKKRLTREQSGRVWKFAEILAKAIEVLGSREEAEQWLERPAIGLEQRRPIELLKTTVGSGLVAELLRRIEYGVYI